MSKVKKILAMILTLAMIMGMTLTVSAAPSTEAPYESNITISGLSEGETTQLNVWKIVSLDANANAWIVADWAKNYVSLNAAKTAYEVTNPTALAEAAADVDPTYAASTTNTAYTFENVPVGAYLILATSSDKKTVYNPMVANTYDNSQDYMASKDAEITAKTSTYPVDKSADDNFIARGEKVTFTVTTIFPSFLNPASAENSYKLIDTPTGLEITRLVSAHIGATDVTANVTGTYNEAKTAYTIDFTSLIGTKNANAGKTVTVVYEALVTSDKGYSNTVNAFRNDVDLGGDDEEGFTGDATITKVDAEDNNLVLKGAEFAVYELADGETWDKSMIESKTPISFVQTAVGEYKKALDGENGATTTLIATNGTLKVTGLDEGKYHFVETKAPAGYSINENGVDVEIIENEEANVSVTGTIEDTKLSSLPETGGIGTTIFTIGGCAIMILAAGLFFASRRKESK